MGHSSILNFGKPPEERVPVKQAPFKKNWGTPEERYRRLCMLCLLFRYSYYVHAIELIGEHEYNALEKLILKIEDKNRLLIHPNSPTHTVGSEHEKDYPRSVVMFWNMHQKDSALHVFHKVLPEFIKDAEEAFGIAYQPASEGESDVRREDAVHTAPAVG